VTWASSGWKIDLWFSRFAYNVTFEAIDANRVIDKFRDDLICSHNDFRNVMLVQCVEHVPIRCVFSDALSIFGTDI